MVGAGNKKASIKTVEFGIDDQSGAFIG